MTNQEEMSAREARNAYMRAWRSENKEKVKAANQRYWEKKSKKLTVSKNKAN